MLKLLQLRINKLFAHTMDLPMFHPSSTHSTKDKLAQRLVSIAQVILVAIGGLLPILFIPSTFVPFSGGKVLLVALAAVIAVAFLVMAMLREGSLNIRFSLILLGVWAIAAVTFVSAWLSGDTRDAMFGNGLDSYTAFFAFLVVLLVTVTSSFHHSKQMVIRLYGVLIFSAFILSIFHIIRVFFGPEVMSFSIFNSSTSSLVGSWNGLAILYGLIVLLVLMALQQLPLNRTGRYIAMVVMLLSFVMLAVINFLPAWWILAVVSGVMGLYHLVRNLWKKSGSDGQSKTKDSLEMLLATIVTFTIAIIFIIGGSSMSSLIGEKLGINFLEVRPSLGATVDITRAVYADDLLLGSGPNRFADMWRIHKDPAINQTIFWNTPFDSGFSYICTSIIGTGLAGIVAYLVFLGGFIWSGFRFITLAPTSDRFWHFIGLSSLVTSVYLLLMSLVYVPPPSILLLGAITTGIFLSSYTRLMPSRLLTISAEKGKVYGMILVVLAVGAVSSTGYIAYAGMNEMFAVYKFNKAMGTVVEGDNLDALNDKIVEAFTVAPNDVFAQQIAFHNLSRMRTILGIAEPSTTEQQVFQDSAARAIEAANTAITLDSTDPFNHQLMGQVYSVLSLIGVEGAGDRARTSFTTAKALDPQNPIIDLLEADLALATEDTALARAGAEEAVRKKSNFTEALFFLAQLDINDGNVDRAVIIVNGIAQMEPQNPARRYQLGVLLASNNQLDEAVEAFEQAVALDPQYANARYFLALGYSEQGRVEEAIEQLNVVRGLSESNNVVDGLIEELQENGELTQSLTEGEVVPERDPEDGVVTESDLENGLVTSPNPVPADEVPVTTNETEE